MSAALYGNKLSRSELVAAACGKRGESGGWAEALDGSCGHNIPYPPGRAAGPAFEFKVKEKAEDAPPPAPKKKKTKRKKKGKKKRRKKKIAIKSKKEEL